MKLKLNVQYYVDREKMVLALANSGYKVWVEEEKIPHAISGTNFFVCFNLKDKTEYSGNKIG